jgi:hypothetical protein
MTFKVVTSILNFYIPTTCMIVLYVRIFLAIKRRSREIQQFGGGGGGGGGGAGAGAVGRGGRDSVSKAMAQTRKGFERNRLPQ